MAYADYLPIFYQTEIVNIVNLVVSIERKYYKRTDIMSSSIEIPAAHRFSRETVVSRFKPLTPPPLIGR